LVDDLHAGLEHLDKALAYFRSEPYPAGRYRLGNNPGVVCLTASGFILWILGHPDRGLQRANEAIDLATGLEHPFTLAYGLFHAGYLHCWRREADLVRDRAERLLQLVDEHDFPLWRALGTCLLGAANTAMGQVEEGLAKVRQGVDLYQGLRIPPVFWPMLRALEAGAYGQAGRVEEALVMVDEALEISGRGSGTTVLPEFQLLKGDLLLALGRATAPIPSPGSSGRSTSPSAWTPGCRSCEPRSGSAGSARTGTLGQRPLGCAPSTTPSPKASPRPI